LRRDRGVAVARRVVSLSTTFRRSVIALGLPPGSPGFRAVFATVAALAHAAELPTASDDKTILGPVRAFVRRVSGRDIWILYRFDQDHVFARCCFQLHPGFAVQAGAKYLRHFAAVDEMSTESGADASVRPSRSAMLGRNDEACRALLSTNAGLSHEVVAAVCVLKSDTRVHDRG
jgi:hypothetical protein